MKFLLWVFFLAGNAATDDNGNYYVIQMPDEEPHRTPTKQFRVFWNVPTMQCKSKGIPFENLFERYGILQNDKDSFRGEKISILYDPGLFPALLKNESTGEYKFRNGGVPQEGDLEKHVASFKTTVEQSIPDPHFSGVGIIDFESWRPIFRQNFGVLVPYKDVSYQIERKKHWIWPEPWIKAEAKRSFEEKARAFMQTTLSIAKQMRPKAQWGYYGFPYCFNMAASNMRERCADRVPAENNEIYWLWLESTALYPSVYSSNTLTTTQLAQMVRGRIREAARVRKSGTPILPYFWFRYHNTNGGYLSEVDLQIAIKTMYESDASGFILWGSSRDVNTVAKCKNLVQYVEKYLGPEVAKYTKYDRMQSMNDEVSTVANDNDHEVFNSTVTTLPTTDKTLSSTVTTSDTTVESLSNTATILPATDRTLSSTVTTSPTTDKTLSSTVTSPNTVESLSNTATTLPATDRTLISTVTSPTTIKSLSSTSSTSLTTVKELNAHEISKPENQSDPEYYDDDIEEQNKTTTIKDLNFQLESEYFWNQPENYTHNIKKQVDDEMRRKSYVSNIELSDKTTTETALNLVLFQLNNYSSEQDGLPIKEAPNLTPQEDELDKILIQSSTADEFMDVLTTITEKGSIYDLVNYESIDIMYDDVETNTKRIKNTIQDEKQDNIESQNERFYREFETYEVGSQFEDQLNADDGSHGKVEKISKITTDDGSEVVTPNIHNKQNGSHDRPESVPNSVMEDGLIAVLPKIIGNNSIPIPKNGTIENVRTYESTSIVSIPGYLNLYPSSKQVIPINNDERLADGPPVLPLHQPEITRNTIKSMSETDLSCLNARKTNNKPYSVSKENTNSVIQKTETIRTQANVSQNNDLNSISSGIDVFIKTNESEKDLINTTPASILLNFLKKPSHILHNDTKVNVNIEQASILPVMNNYDDNIIINDTENGMTFEKATTNGTESTTISTVITKNFTKDLSIAKESERPRTFKSKNEKKGLPKIKTEVIGTATENPDREEWNLPILSDQVTGSSAHRVSGIRYYYCIIFYFYSVSKCICDYYGQCS